VKMNWIYDLPFGPKRRYLSNYQNVFLRKALEGWEIASVTRVQSGSPIRVTSGRLTFDQNDSGVVLHGITARQLQDMTSITKSTNAQGQGIVTYLPQYLIDNSLAAFDLAPVRLWTRASPTLDLRSPASSGIGFFSTVRCSRSGTSAW